VETEASRICRVVKMLTTLQSGKPYNAETLAKAMRISRRTIFRDLRDLRKAGVAIYFDETSHRYIIETAPLWPVGNLNSQEILSLLLLVHKAKDHIHLPFNNLALLAAQKIEKELPEELRQYCDDMLRDISVKVCQPAKTDILDKIFLQLRQAVVKKRSVKFHYYLYDEQNAHEMELHPYHMVYVHNAWHVIGKTNGGEIRTFKLGHMSQLRVLDKFFTKDKSFNVHDYLGRAWAAEPEGRIYEVKLDFQPEVARSVAEVEWHKTQVVTFDPDGSVIVEFHVDGLNEIIPWVLSYGDKVTVMGPDVLRQEILRINRRAIERNHTIGFTVVE
jgi:predicted DNA-binding transcriptional regulator YafY